jgi:hypothetical protein
MLGPGSGPNFLLRLAIMEVMRLQELNMEWNWRPTSRAGRFHLTPYGSSCSTCLLPPRQYSTSFVVLILPDMLIP